MVDEIWKPVVGYEGMYEVSDTGRVRSIDRCVPMSTWARNINGRVLVANIFPNGYVGYNLWKNNTVSSLLAHRLVCEVFNGPPPTKEHVVNHIDGDRKKNTPVNLEWVTRSENIKHAFNVLGVSWTQEAVDARIKSRRRRQYKGERAQGEKLTVHDIPAIRSELSAGKTQASIAKQFGVSRRAIGMIKSGDTWSHVP